jgi:Putative prokaryotic signal transducing protein
MLVTVARFRDPWEAQMLRGRLEAEDIPAFVVHQYHIGTVWYLSRALHGVKVQVLSDDVAEARAVMARCSSGAYSAELLELFGTLGEPQCPNCGSISCKRRPVAAQATFAFVVFLLTRVVIPPTTWRRTCRVCGTRWVE